MTVSIEHLWLIAGLTLITLLFRLGGYFGGEFLQRFPLVQQALTILPRLILASLIARSLVGAPLVVWVAAAASLLAALLLRNVLIVMLVGVGIVLIATLVGGMV